MTLPVILKPKGHYSLSRIGPNNDGGYLVGEKSIHRTKYLISLGIFDDWAFEKDFLDKNNNIQIYCYDDVLSPLWLLKNIFKFFLNLKFRLTLKKIEIFIDYFLIKKKINFNKKKIVSRDLLEISKGKKDILLKIDIEGSEYRILDDILETEKNLIGLVIEFHDVDLHLEKIINFIKSLKYLQIIHIHPNNFGNISFDNKPTIVEITFEHNPELISKEFNLPNPQDSKNDPSSEDIELKFNNN